MPLNWRDAIAALTGAVVLPVLAAMLFPVDGIWLIVLVPLGGLMGFWIYSMAAGTPKGAATRSASARSARGKVGQRERTEAARHRR